MTEPTTPQARGDDRVDWRGLAHHLEATRMAGEVATPPVNAVNHCHKMLKGDDNYTMGLDDWRTSDLDEALAAVVALCGGDPLNAEEPDGPGWIEPTSAIVGIRRHAEMLGDFRRAGGGTVLIATGHPTGLLGHYIAIAHALRDHGAKLLTPLDDTVQHIAWDDRPRSVRFVEGVGALSDGGSLRHTHLSRYAEAMLDALDDPPDLVIGDHGMAGAAIARGITTISIADVNDPALPLAQLRGRTEGVLVIDDNVAPRHYRPLTQAMLTAAQLR